MANIKDLAKHAGVSVTTVSRVLNHHPYVNEEKKERVLASMEELNYERNINAVHLSTGKTNVIGVVVPFVNHPYFSTLLQGISDEALKRNHQLMLFQTNYEVETELKALHMLKMKQMDGLIFCSRACGWEVLQDHKRYGPIALCENVQDSFISSVYINHFEAFRHALNYLIQCNHSKIGYCIGRSTGSNSKNRIQAYNETMNELGETIRDDWIFTNSYTLEDGINIAKSILIKEERPSALLVSSDQVAAGIYMECERNGYKIPDDLAIVGFDNDAMASYLNLSTIELPLVQMGQQLLKVVLKGQYGLRKEMPFTLIERQSV
ncbi:LacI family transcription regulator [Pontibacillus halophilus JSM 076056 = DSM 19796]|uniref:LacI family transcription regulator n=1 Tax=Pontibacillus halophilus JSM 076056 = DSM 19796 TaxID=1385510 RepID=A0A0A5I8E0_9BACI|nr:LacI family DNA-binding transcriptional regulator [Pontibacillus halophilus]KGX92102.1 LacI family transcription regulator [Pontibacillus halophilus JSM 076056 = DSM 19796]